MFELSREVELNNAPFSTKPLVFPNRGARGFRSHPILRVRFRVSYPRALLSSRRNCGVYHIGLYLDVC